MEASATGDRARRVLVVAGAVVHDDLDRALSAQSIHRWPTEFLYLILPKSASGRTRVFDAGALVITSADERSRELWFLVSVWVQPPGTSGCAESGDQFDLHCDVKGQLCESDGAAGVPTRFTEDLDEQIGASIDDCRGLVESGRDIDHAEHLDYAGYTVKITQFGLQGGQDRQGSQTGSLFPVLEGQIGAHLAADDFVPADWPVAPDVDQVILDHATEIVARWGKHWGKDDSKLYEPRGCHARTIVAGVASTSTSGDHPTDDARRTASNAEGVPGSPFPRMAFGGRPC